jgi:hypothetical protein
MDNQVTILVQLMNEGTTVFRPTTAEKVGQGLFKLLPTPGYDPNNEEWEFLPGSIVLGQIQVRDNEEILVAVSKSQI